MVIHLSLSKSHGIKCVVKTIPLLEIYYSQKVLRYLEDNCAWPLLLVLNSKINHKVFQLLLPNERSLDTFRCENDYVLFYFPDFSFLNMTWVLQYHKEFFQQSYLVYFLLCITSISYLYHLHNVKYHINNIFSMEAVYMAMNLCNTDNLSII